MNYIIDLYTLLVEEIMVITKTTCKECEYKNTRQCPYYGINEPVRVIECEGKENLNCCHIINERGNV